MATRTTEPTRDDSPESGGLLLRLLELLGWHVTVTRDEGVHVTAVRPDAGLRVEARAGSLPEAAFAVFEHAFDALRRSRRDRVPAAA